MHCHSPEFAVWAPLRQLQTASRSFSPTHICLTSLLCNGQTQGQTGNHHSVLSDWEQFTCHHRTRVELFQPESSANHFVHVIKSTTGDLQTCTYVTWSAPLRMLVLYPKASCFPCWQSLLQNQPGTSWEGWGLCWLVQVREGGEQKSKVGFSTANLHGKYLKQRKKTPNHKPDWKETTCPTGWAVLALFFVFFLEIETAQI